MDDAAKNRIHESFDAQSMMATLGARLEEVSTGHVVITAPILPSSQQQQGFAHAGLTFSIGDSAAGYAALSTLPPDTEVVTAEMKINLLAPATGDYLKAVGRVIKPGKRLQVVACDVFAIAGSKETHVALLQGTMMPVPRQPQD